MSHPVFCETVELAVEASALATAIGLAISVELTADPLGAAIHHPAAKTGGVCALSLTLPGPERVVAAASACPAPGRLVVGALTDPDGLQSGLIGDLGFVCLLDVAPAMAALALVVNDAQAAYRANARKLSPPDRARIAKALLPTDKSGGRLVSLGAAGIAFHADPVDGVALGRASDVARALIGLAAAERSPGAPVPLSPEIGLEASRDVLFGPPRVLSDPASKAALIPFGLPLPQEELCASPSRAAVEAARIGFPVRISLASPDLRVWDFPDLSVDGVDNAARVRDVYRQLTLSAETRAPTARVLGVTVTATTLARALLRITARPLPEGHVLLRVGFCDPHGAVTKDCVATVLPQSERGLLRALDRLAARALLWEDPAAARDARSHALVSLLVRLCTFVHSFRREVEKVELHPVALLVGGGAEVREAAVQVTDAFVRDLGG